MVGIKLNPWNRGIAKSLRNLITEHEFPSPELEKEKAREIIEIMISGIGEYSNRFNPLIDLDEAKKKLNKLSNDLNYNAHFIIGVYETQSNILRRLKLDIEDRTTQTTERFLTNYAF